MPIRNSDVGGTDFSLCSGPEKGGALLTVLWLSAALAAIAFSVATTVRSETDRVSSSAEGLRAYYLASGSVERAIQWMMWGSTVRNPDGSPRWQPSGASRRGRAKPTAARDGPRPRRCAEPACSVTLAGIGAEKTAWAQPQVFDSVIVAV